MPLKTKLFYRLNVILRSDEAHGDSVDYYYNHGIPFTSTIEVHGDDFVYPENLLKQATDEVSEGLLAGIHYVYNYTRINRGRLDKGDKRKT